MDIGHRLLFIYEITFTSLVLTAESRNRLPIHACKTNIFLVNKPAANKKNITVLYSPWDVESDLQVVWSSR